MAGTSTSNLGASSFEPTTPHFFQPILSENQYNLRIPLKFYRRYVEGKITADEIELTSDASAVVWKVKIEGRELTEGFGAFAASHDYRVGDIAIFRYEGGVRFHVTACGPSCCEIEYTFETEINDDENLAEEDEEQCVTLDVTDDTIRSRRMFIPKNFCESSGLQNHGGGEITLIDDAGAKWQVRLVKEISKTRGRMRIAGLREFLEANEIKAHDKLVFRLICENESTPALLLCKKIRTT